MQTNGCFNTTLICVKIYEYHAYRNYLVFPLLIRKITKIIHDIIIIYKGIFSAGIK